MTNYFKALAFTAVLTTTGAATANADAWDKKTTITINEPMQLPNMTLQPGTYVVRLADLDANRHVVQFFNKDETKLIDTVMAIPNSRLQPTGKSVFAFWETPSGQPKALRGWFYPGDNFGQEFTYPKDEAARIAANNQGATVPVSEEKAGTASARHAAHDDNTAAAQPPPEPTPAPEAATAVAQPVQAQNSTPEPAPVEVAAAPQQDASPVAASSSDAGSDAQRVSPSTQPETLPKTASNLPLLALIGLLSMAAALAVHLAYRRA